MTAPARGHRRTRCVGLTSLVLLAAIAAAFAPTQAAARTLAVVSTEYVAPVTPSEAAAYYQAVAEALGALADIKLLEREQLATVLDERDIALAFGPDDADGRYASAGKSMEAEQVVVPAISRLENDYLLCLRVVSVPSAATRACSVHRTRLVSKFAEHAARQVQELLAEQPATDQAPADTEMAPVALVALRQACIQAGAERLFPALWERCEKLLEAADAQSAPRLAHYYVTLLSLCARASAPPRGMVFVPGGYVSVDTPEGERRLWVEPFFMDRCEVTVAEYTLFVRAAEARGEEVRKLLSITRNDRDLGSPDLPVTGITCEAAEAYARSEGKALPTMLQWLRAACGDDGREYPCGGADRLGACRLKTAPPPAAPLEPAGVTAGDAGPFGTIHMTGNVREWTCTWYDREAYSRTPADRPREPADGTLKIVKGGSWRTDASQAACRAFERFKPTEAFDDVGFRCVRPFTWSDAPAVGPIAPQEPIETRNTP